MHAIDAIRLDDPSFLLPSPHAEMAALRREAPVVYDARTDAWVVSSYDSVSFALRHPEIFISGRGVSVEERKLGADGPVHGGDFMLATDAPRHTELRAAVQPGYVQPRIRAWEDRLQSRVVAAIDALPAGEVFDAHARIAKTLAITSVCDYLGISEQDVPWIDELTSIWSPEQAQWSGESVTDYPEGTLERYFAVLLEERAAAPVDDVLTVIAGERGASLSLRAKLMLCIDLVVAGNEPLAAGISGGLHALAEHPDAFARLQREPELIPTAVNELLRRVTPVPYMCRTTAADVELEGQLIPAGSFVYLLYSSANHDEEVWGDPYELDVARSDAGKLLSFGRGAHTCIGAPLVRHVYRILLEQLTSRFAALEMGGDVRIIPGVHMPHLGLLPIVLVPASTTHRDTL